MNEAIKVKGTFRLNITEDGEVVGDSGWTENQITLDGFKNIALLIGGLGGAAVSHVAVGTGGVPASNATSLAGEVEVRAAVTASSSSNSKAVSFFATFSSADSFVTDTQNLLNIGLFSASNSGNLYAGNTYASSSCASNQDLAVTYVISFA